MKVVVAGGRDRRLTPDMIDFLDHLREQLPITELVSGTARGIDSDAEVWALSSDLPVVRFPPDWSRFGTRAGPQRNRQMAVYADAVVLFPGGAGTASMRREALKANRPLYEWAKANTP